MLQFVYNWYSKIILLLHKNTISESVVTSQELHKSMNQSLNLLIIFPKLGFEDIACSIQNCKSAENYHQK